MHLHNGPIAGPGELGFLEIEGDPAQAGELPACAWFPGYRQKSVKIMPPAIIRSPLSAREFYRDGKERRRQFLKATEAKRRLLPLVVT